MTQMRNYTLSWRQSQDIGIDYRDFEYCECLPEGIPLVAVAGIWNDRCSIRCLFVDKSGKTYRRHISGSSGQYMIKELDVNAKEIEVGQVFVVHPK